MLFVMVILKIDFPLFVVFFIVTMMLTVNIFLLPSSYCQAHLTAQRLDTSTHAFFFRADSRQNICSHEHTATYWSDCTVLSNFVFPVNVVVYAFEQVSEQRHRFDLPSVSKALDRIARG
jgi:hypothetical protein